MIDTEIVSFDPYFDGFAKMSHSIELRGQVWMNKIVEVLPMIDQVYVR